MRLSRFPRSRVIYNRKFKKDNSKFLRENKLYFQDKGLYHPRFEDGIDLSGVSFLKTVLVDAIMKNIDLSSCIFGSTEFYYSDLEGSNFTARPNSLIDTPISFNKKK